MEGRLRAAFHFSQGQSAPVWLRGQIEVMWNRAVSMPARYKGRRVLVTVGQGTQLDGSGNVMGRMMAFTAIKFLD